MNKVYPIKIVSTQPKNLLEIRWAVSNFCNFTCDYCYPGANSGTDRGPRDLTTALKNFNHLFREYKKKLGVERFNFIITGGEPTLWPPFGEFIQKMKEKHDIIFTVMSNGSRTLRWWEEYGHYIDDAVLSFHSKEGDLEHHTQVLNILAKNGKRVTNMVLMDPKHWDKCYAAVGYFQQNMHEDVFLQVKPLVDHSQMHITYTDEQRKYLLDQNKWMPTKLWFRKNLSSLVNGDMRIFLSEAELDDGTKIRNRTSSLVNKGYTYFKDWTCNVGIESVYIEWNGNIMGACTQKLYGLDYYLNIFDENFSENNINFVPVTCEQVRCVCQPDTHVTKSL